MQSVLTWAKRPSAATAWNGFWIRSQLESGRRCLASSEMDNLGLEKIQTTHFRQCMLMYLQHVERRQQELSPLDGLCEHKGKTMTRAMFWRQYNTFVQIRVLTDSLAVIPEERSMCWTVIIESNQQTQRIHTATREKKESTLLYINRTRR